MDKLFSLFGDATHSKLGGGDSFSDQLSCKYTVYLLSTIAVLSTTRVFVDEPISCFCPTQFTSSQVDFTKKVCWTTNTHYVSLDTANVPGEHDQGKQFISYYQWIPSFLACQAVFFYMPRAIWKKLSRKSGLSVSHVTDAAIECLKKSDNENAAKIMKYMTKTVSKFLTEFNRSYRSSTRCKSIWCIFYGNFLVEVYLIVKALYVGNAIGQLFLLNTFLGNDYHLYGVDVIRKILTGENWTTSRRFPRVTICDFHIRALGNIHRHTVQCALPMNLFYEMIFMMLWVWIVFVFASSLASLFFWAYASLNLPYQEAYVRRRLMASDRICREDKDRVRSFVRKHLRRDGCLLIQMVSSNANDIVAAELLAGLWDEYNDSDDSNYNRKDNKDGGRSWADDKGKALDIPRNLNKSDRKNSRF